MNNDKTEISCADQLLFIDEEVSDGRFCPEPWNVLAVDDEEDVLTVTRMVLEDTEFDGRKIRLLSARSAAEARVLLQQRDDIGVILLDVVMESHHAGLDLVRFIRDDLGNKSIRIVLRTGQPGSAPERKVIVDYDINDYKEKSSLTATRLFTTVISALRGYRDIRTIEQSKRGLEYIVNAAADLFRPNSLDTFCQGVLEQLTALWDLGDDCLYLRNSGFAALREEGNMVIHAGIGSYRDMVGKGLDEVVSDRVREMIYSSLKSGKPIIGDHDFVGCYRSAPEGESLIYLSSNRPLEELDIELIRVFSTHIASAFDNLSLNRELKETQREIIYALGELVEQRSKEIGSHVRRVGEQARHLALLTGIEEDEAELLRIAAPMHDVGKIGIPDYILEKPGKLTAEEFKVIESHTLIGYHILCKSRRPILQAAAIVAREHHEHWDGGGYPRGLKGEEIHLFGRITAISDVLDALYHKRPYKEAWGQEEIRELFRQQRGKQFEPRLIDLLFEHWDEFIEIQQSLPD